MNQTATRKSIAELQVGDVVIDSNGIRALVTDPPTLSTAHPRGGPAGDVYWTSALVLNAGDVVGLAYFLRADDGGTWTDSYTGRWTLQGNDLNRLHLVQTGQSIDSVGLSPTRR